VLVALRPPVTLKSELDQVVKFDPGVTPVVVTWPQILLVSMRYNLSRPQAQEEVKVKAL
jgi:hypothetical protein